MYSLTRMTTLLAVILDLTFLNTTTRINCQAWVTLQITNGCLSSTSATLLIAFRIIAIWNRNKIITAIVTTLCLTNIAVSILGVSRLRSDWDAASQQCAVLNTDSIKPQIVVHAIIDIVLLLIALVGLLRLRRDGGGKIGVGLFLWKQGILWLLIALLAEVPPAVLIILNLNDPFNLMFQLPSVIALSIAAARTYRTSTDFAPVFTHIGFDNVHKSNSECPRSHGNQDSFNPIEVTVDMSYEQHQMLRIGRHDPCISPELVSEEQKCEKPRVFGFRQTSGETV